jgi:hypothetical protein
VFKELFGLLEGKPPWELTCETLTEFLHTKSFRVNQELEEEYIEKSI